MDNSEASNPERDHMITILIIDPNIPFQQSLKKLLTSYNLPEYQKAAKDSGIEHLIPKDEWTGDEIISLVKSIVSDLEYDIK